MRLLGWVVAAVLVLPLVKAAAQLLLIAMIVLALLFALRQPQETLGCGTVLVLVALLREHPWIALSALVALGFSRARSKVIPK